MSASKSGFNGQARRDLQRLLVLIDKSGPFVPLLLGAGASIASGAAGGDDLARRILEQLYEDGSDAHAGHGNGSRLERSIAEIGGGAGTRRLLLADHLESLVPSPGYRRLAVLLAERSLSRLVFTTNFDELVERACEEVGLDVLVVASAHDVPLRLDLDDRVVVIKLHGTLAEPETMRCQPAEVARLPPAMADLLQEHVEAHGLLVVGNRLRDDGVLRVLAQACPTKGFVGLVTPGSPEQIDDAVIDVLEHHRSSRHRVDATFEELLGHLATRLRTRTAYKRHEAELRARWDLLDRGRYCADRRLELERLCAVSDDAKEDAIEDAVALAHEGDAIMRLAKFELGGKTDSLLLDEGMRHLMRAFGDRSLLPLDARARLLGRYAQEQSRFLFHGIDGGVPGDEHGEAGRAAQARAQLDVIERELAELEGRVSDTALLYARLYSAELLKELHALDADTNEKAEDERMAGQLVKARDRLEGVVDVLRQPTGAHELAEKEVQWLRGLAQRHLAIVHEYFHALPLPTARRESHLESWLAYSEAAAHDLEAAGEDWARGYAIMNWATADIARDRLYRKSAAPSERADDILARLHRAVGLLEAVDDYRGLAWGHVQIGLALLNCVAPDDPGIDRLERCHRHALVARTWATRAGTDRIVAGFADYLAARSLLDLTQADHELYERAEDQLEMIVTYAEVGRRTLRGTARNSQAAYCAWAKGEALYRLASLEAQEYAAARLTDAIQSQANAIQYLADSGEIGRRELEQQFSALSRAVRPSLQEMAL